MSEQSSFLCTQGNVLEDSNNSSIMPFGLTQAERHTRSKPRFAEFACSVEEVSYPFFFRAWYWHVPQGASLCKFGNRSCYTESLLGVRRQPPSSSPMWVFVRFQGSHFFWNFVILTQMWKSSSIVDVLKPLHCIMFFKGLALAIVTGLCRLAW